MFIDRHCDTPWLVSMSTGSLCGLNAKDKLPCRLHQRHISKSRGAGVVNFIDLLTLPSGSEDVPQGVRVLGRAKVSG
jgi:hypothetical protein